MNIQLDLIELFPPGIDHKVLNVSRDENPTICFRKIINIDAKESFGLLFLGKFTPCSVYSVILINLQENDLSVFLPAGFCNRW